MRNTLVIGDTHIPFEHKDYLSFCKRIYKDLKCSRVVHIGDLVDNHAISYHEHDPNGLSPAEEMERADTHLKAWFKAFPNVSMCRGNHDRLVDRKGRTAGLPQRCFRDFHDIWNLPKGWVDDFSFIFDGVLYIHGTGYSGRGGHMKAATDNMMPTVVGHNHSFAGIEYISNERDTIFGMNVGCGIDRKKYAFAYGKDFPKKPIVSCGVVSYTSHGVNATIYRMLT